MIKGIDISKWQGTVDFNALKSAVSFVIIRSSYGNGYTDEQFARNRDEARRVGLPRGFYHYAYPTYNSPEAEADWFLKVVGTPQDGELLCLDFEEKYGDPVNWCKRFLDRLSSQLGGYKPLIYINLNFNNLYDWSPIVASDYGLWLAKWDYNPAASAPGTDWKIVAMRQYTNSETVPGISARVDGNVFYGDVQAFVAYGYHPPVSNPAPEQPKTVPLTQFTELEQAFEALRKEYQALSARGREEIGKLTEQLGRALNERDDALSKLAVADAERDQAVSERDDALSKLSECQKQSNSVPGSGETAPKTAPVLRVDQIISQIIAKVEEIIKTALKGR